MSDSDSFTETKVADAVGFLRKFADDRNLGAPIKALTCENLPGIGAEWDGAVRNAVLFPNGSNHADVAEAKRRIIEWMANV